MNVRAREILVQRGKSCATPVTQSSQGSTSRGNQWAKWDQGPGPGFLIFKPRDRYPHLAY